jgi:hypoxanthine phosphoribosyltransferase
VLFTPGYQSSYLANEKSLDFIIAFYHGGTFVSASLINAYTIKQARLSYLTTSFYNTYLSNVKTNDGARIPNLLTLTGKLSISEINGANYD